MKDNIKLRLRETMRVVKIPSTEPYRAAVLDYLNRLFVSKREKCWHRVLFFAFCRLYDIIFSKIDNFT